MAGSSGGDLKQWLVVHGGYIHPDLNLFTPDDLKGRSVTATSRISKGTEIVRVPLEACIVATATGDLSIGPAENSRPLQDYLKGHRNLTPFLKLVLTVLHESSKGGDSRFKPFLDSLPQEHNCVLGWNPSEKAALQGTSIEAEAQQDIQKTFTKVVLPVINGNPDLWPGEWQSFRKFCNVAGIVQSRTFHLQEDNWLTGLSTAGADLYMIPTIDMVNHSTDFSLRNTSLHKRQAASAPAESNPTTAPAAQQTSELPNESGATLPSETPAPDTAAQQSTADEGQAGGTKPQTEENAGSSKSAAQDYFVLETDADIEVGDELLHTYGDLSDAELLNIFGFIDTMEADFDNPHNSVLLPSELLIELCQEQKSGRRLGKNFKRRQQFLEEAGMLPAHFEIIAQEPLPDSLITATQILLLSDMAEFSDLRLEILKEKKKSGETALLGKETLDDSEHSMFVCTTLLRVLEEQVATLARVEHPEGSPRLRQAAHVQEGTRKILQTQKRELVKLMMSLQSDDEGGN